MYVLPHRGVVLQLHEGLSPVLLHNSQIRCHTLLRHQPANLPVLKSLQHLQVFKPVLWILNAFFSDPDPIFQLASGPFPDPHPVSDSKILDVNFTSFSEQFNLQINFGYEAARIRNYFFWIRILLKFRLRPDPDPQHSYKHYLQVTTRVTDPESQGSLTPPRTRDPLEKVAKISQNG